MLANHQTLYTGTISRDAIATVCEVIGIDPKNVTYVEIDGSEFYALAEHSIEEQTPKATP